MFFSRATAVLVTAYLLSLSSANALPFHKREVPQEHSHEKYLVSANKQLKKNNPNNILDAVFGLLGNTAALQGIGKISDPDCLHQATADQAFTNAKADGDIQGMVDALIFAAVERNTGAVGLKSKLCTAIPAVNPEIAALTQHQDPASEGAAETNKAITLELARQIAAVGGDPLLALDAGTFAPGQIGDPTARGNSCNVATDPIGCIFTQNLLVPDATPEEIQAAVADVVAGPAATVAPDAAPTATPPGVCPPAVTVTQTVTVAAPEVTVAAEPPCPTDPVTITVTSTATSSATDAAVTKTVAVTTTETAAAAPTAPASASATGGNLQKFGEALGGVKAPAVFAQGTQFCAEGNSCFNSLQSAIVRSCDVQNNKCANASNGAGQAKVFSVGDCNQQQGRCITLARAS